MIYSTALGPVCPGCARAVDQCACRKIKRAALPETDGIARLRHETKGRKGKGVTIVSGLPLSEEGLWEVIRKLKQRLGTGGSVKEYSIELQGDHREQLKQELGKLGYTVK